jgi:hypothetical protein
LRGLCHTLGQGCIAFVVDAFNPSGKVFEQRLTKNILLHQHTLRMTLNDRHAVVPINNQSGQEVALAVYKSENVGVFVVEKSRFLPIVNGRRQSFFPKSVVNLRFFKGKNFDGDTVVLGVTRCKIMLFGRIDFYDATFGQTANVGNERTGKYPRMKPL